MTARREESMHHDPIPPPRELVERFRRVLDRMPSDGTPGYALEQAGALFQETFGAAPLASASAASYVPLIAEHTSLFPGFGLLVRLPWGVAAAVSLKAEPPGITAFGADASLLSELVAALRRSSIDEAAGADYQVALVSTMGNGGEEALLASAAVALLRALAVMPESKMAASATRAVEEVLGRPVGPALALASLADGPIVVIDASTSESLPLERPADAGFGLIELGAQEAPEADLFRNRLSVVEESLARLRAAGFTSLTSLRKIEHQDLPEILRHVDLSARPLINHLVTEDRRIPRMIASIKRGDPQIIGAMLLMSHAARREELKGDQAAVDYLTGMAEETEGIYGIRLAGPVHARRVLVVGRSFIVPGFLDNVSEGLQREVGILPQTFVL